MSSCVPMDDDEFEGLRLDNRVTKCSAIQPHTPFSLGIYTRWLRDLLACLNDFGCLLWWWMVFLRATGFSVAHMSWLLNYNQDNQIRSEWTIQLYTLLQWLHHFKTPCGEEPHWPAMLIFHPLLFLPLPSLLRELRSSIKNFLTIQEAWWIEARSNK